MLIADKQTNVQNFYFNIFIVFVCETENELMRLLSK